MKVEKQSLEAELTELRAKYVPRGITTAHPLVADRASPVRLRFSPGSVLIEAQTEGRARAVETVRAAETVGAVAPGAKTGPAATAIGGEVVLALAGPG